MNSTERPMTNNDNTSVIYNMTFFIISSTLLMLYNFLLTCWSTVPQQANILNGWCTMMLRCLSKNNNCYLLRHTQFMYTVLSSRPRRRLFQQSSPGLGFVVVVLFVFGFCLFLQRSCSVAYLLWVFFVFFFFPVLAFRLTQFPIYASILISIQWLMNFSLSLITMKFSSYSVKQCLILQEALLTYMRSATKESYCSK